MMNLMTKMSTKGRTPLKAVPRTAILGFVGGFVCIGILSLLTGWTSASWLMAPFGASCVLAFGLWEAPLSQPRNIIGGHVVSTLTGLIVFHMLGQGPAALALGVGLAISAMILTKTTHPPAGADPIVVISAGSDWSFLVSPVLIGSVLIVICALIINNLDEHRKYPTFWI